MKIYQNLKPKQILISLPKNNPFSYEWELIDFIFHSHWSYDNKAKTNNYSWWYDVCITGKKGKDDVYV